VIISGGISSDNDFKKIAYLDYPGIAGVITGKAFYEKKINLQESIIKYQKPYRNGEEW